MSNIVPLGTILNNFRQNSFPLTQEYIQLSDYLTELIRTKVEVYFSSLDSWKKIIKNRKSIASDKSGMNNCYELLIYAAIWTEESRLLLKYIDKKLERPVRNISQTEFLKPEKEERDQVGFYNQIRQLAVQKEFAKMQELIGV